MAKFTCEVPVGHLDDISLLLMDIAQMINQGYTSGSERGYVWSIEDDETEARTAKAIYVKEIEVRDPDTGNEVGVSIYKTEGGGMVGFDSSFIEQEVGPVYSPFDRGFILDLNDGKEE